MSQQDTDKPAANTDQADSDAPELASVFEDHMVVLNALPYHATREALAKNTFEKHDETPWPTAILNNRGTLGHAQLRPLAADQHGMLPPEALDKLTRSMWLQREELNDLDADVLDALSAFWIKQTTNPNGDALAKVDDFLRLRGLKPKKGGRGEGGYRPEQRMDILRALFHIQNLWLNVSEIEAFDQERSSPVRKSIQSRAFIITDRMGQLELDGTMDVDQFIFRPGKVFAHYLFGPGRQTALLAAQALRYDYKKQAREKRLVRYLSWQWRIQARTRSYQRTYRVSTLLDTIGEDTAPKRPGRIRERLEKALDTLEGDFLISAWHYERWDENKADKRGWFKLWLDATILIEPPENIKAHYESITEAQRQSLEPSDDLPLGQRMLNHRTAKGESQTNVARQLGISQTYLSKLERGKSNPDRISFKLKQGIDKWLQS